jgi:phosphoenolpyruvate carboxykinase (GTP)
MFDYLLTHPYRLEFMDANTVSFDKSKTNNQALLKWLDKMVDMCGPKEVRWCDGSDREWDELCGLMIEQGSMIALNKEKRPNSYLVRS